LEIERAAASALALPTLNDVVRQFAERAFLDIELKVVGLEALLLSALAENPRTKGVVVSSFLPEVLVTLRGLAPKIPLGLLAETEDQLRGWRDHPVEWVVPHFRLADGQLIRDVHAAGKRVMVWTVNRAAGMREFAEWGADAMISDETELLTRSVIP
jgi:glycerophosphoryl diester phosphodiesterase